MSRVRVYRETESSPIGPDPRVCGRCGGSGGGPDKALKCPVCRGTGRDPYHVDPDEAEYLADIDQEGDAWWP